MIQREIQDQLAEEILAGKVADGTNVVVDAGEEHLVLKPEKGPEVTDAAA